MASRPIPADLLPWALTTLGQPRRVSPTLEVIAGDASNRRYFRLNVEGKHYVVAEAPPETEKNSEFIAIRELLAHGGVRVPGLLGFELQRGYLLLEDLGDQVLLPLLNSESVAGYYSDALSILRSLAQIDLSEAGLPTYDSALLGEELQRFDDWFVQALLGHSLTEDEQSLIARFGRRLVDSALEQPRVMVHRDFHSRNLMLTDSSAMAVIDFQDAVSGPVTYDLVSLLRDCYIRWPEPQLRSWALSHRDSLVELGLIDSIDDQQFMRWFDWMGLQRHIKVLGTFARLYLRDGKSAYLDDLPLVVSYTQSVLATYRGSEPAFKAFGDWFDEALMPLIASQSWSVRR